MSIKLTDKQKMIYDDLSMPEKIAILLIQLGEEATALIFSHMDVDVITEISGYIATAKNIDKQVAGAIFRRILRSNAVKSIYEKWRLRVCKRNFIPHIWSRSCSENFRQAC